MSESQLKVINPMSCDCTVKYGPRGPKGKSTEMTYDGKGVFTCPKCGKVENMHNGIFRMYLQFGQNEEEELYTVKLIDPIIDPRLNEKKDPSEPYEKMPCTMREVIEGSLEDFADDFENHEEGIFEVDLRYSSSWDEMEGDGDVEIEIVAERKLDKIPEVQAS